MKIEMTIEEFDELLAVYGSGRTRWPIERRAAAGRLLARDAAARRLLAEAEALERVLDVPPLPPRDLGALALRIEAAARATPRLAASSPAPARLTLAPRAPARWRLSSVDPVSLGALVTAASLALGILIGLSGQLQSVLRPVQQLTGLPVASASSTHTSAFDTLDEDLL
ncbi:MAG: hypothetical protein NW223_18530 [Hyphomicrobiaceae bacterium]|nr:hypothetical protein [Hyphomicrobiaceae bacterium]